MSINAAPDQQKTPAREFFVARIPGTVVYNTCIMDILPLPLSLSIVSIFGLIIGSFLDVFVTRFHTGKSINGRSHCMSCGHTLSWYELFPLLSYLILRGRCRNCGGHIPIRLLLMELATSALFILVFLTAANPAELGFGFVLMSLLIVIAAYDMHHMVIPNEFVFAVFCVSLLHMAAFFFGTYDAPALLPFFFAAVCASAFYGALWLFSKGRWIGLGDVKLAFPLGLFLVPLEAFSFIVLSFWVGAAVSLLVLAVQHLLYSGQHRLPILHGPLTMKSEVPFAPFMIAAFILVYFGHVHVLAVMTGLF